MEQFGHAAGRAGNAIEDQLATGEPIGEPYEQLPDVGCGEVGQHALGDHEGGSVDRDLVQPAGVGGRGGEQPVSGMFGVEAATEFDDVGEVEVVPPNTLRYVEPEGAAIQPAAEVQHGRVAVAGKKLPGPVVQPPGPQQWREAAGRPSFAVNNPLRLSAVIRSSTSAAQVSPTIGAVERWSSAR